MDPQVRVVKAPRWMFKGGIDLEPYIDDALERIGSEIERRQGRGMGARNNVINRQRESALTQRVMTTRRNPRNSGGSWLRKQGSRFRGMSPRVVRKYIVQPLAALWRAS